MKKSKVILTTLLIVVIVGAVIGVYTYWYNGVHYFKTDNASISANTVTITPLMSGNVTSWNVKEGDDVVANQVLGKQDLSTMVSSSSISTTTLSNNADTLVSKADIKTPISGKVVQSNVIVGETLAPSMQAAIVADTSNMYIVANVEETSIFKIKAGQKVDISVDAYPGKHFTGYVQNVSLATQSAFSTMANLNTSGTYTKVTQLIPVKISIVNDANLPLLMGMNATIIINIK